MKNQARKRKPIPFSWRSWDEMMQKWSLKRVTWSVWVNFSWERKWIDIKSSRLKLVLKCKTRVFCDWYKSPISRQDTRQNTSSQKIWKNLLSVFHDWKSHSRGSCELSRENLCVPLTTGLFTRKQVAKIDSWARDCGMWVGWPATESPKQGNAVFEIFQFLRN